MKIKNILFQNLMILWNNDINLFRLYNLFLTSIYCDIIIINVMIKIYIRIFEKEENNNLKCIKIVEY